MAQEFTVTIEVEAHPGFGTVVVEERAWHPSDAEATIDRMVETVVDRTKAAIASTPEPLKPSNLRP